jgi:hypothetical protein
VLVLVCYPGIGSASVLVLVASTWRAGSLLGFGGPSCTVPRGRRCVGDILHPIGHCMSFLGAGLLARECVWLRRMTGGGGFVAKPGPLLFHVPFAALSVPSQWL